MATDIVKPKSEQVQAPTGHPTSGRDYTKLTINELDDLIDEFSRNVDSMLCMCTGDCFDGFDGYSESTKHAYLLAISNHSMQLCAAIAARNRRYFLKKAA